MSLKTKNEPIYCNEENFVTEKYLIVVEGYSLLDL